MSKQVSGFSKLNKSEKIDWLTSHYLQNSEIARTIIEQYWNDDKSLQKLHDEFIENTLTNYYLPFGIAPNFLINGKDYAIPLAIEESSVVAAASKAAKFWYNKGGFKAEVIATEKIGQVHFMFDGNSEIVEKFFKLIKPKLISDAGPITQSMERRGGGIVDIELRDKTSELKNYYQLHATFNTKDAMGANFINSCLEQFAETLKSEAQNYNPFIDNGYLIKVVMSILSNYTPNCLVKASVSCLITDLDTKTHTGKEFAERFLQATQIAEIEPFRAVTHNKGIMNGIDAVILATGNDFRAIEAAAHAYASKDGKYTSLTRATVNDDVFNFSIEVPLALGTVGGLTNVHPLVKVALQILGNPSAEELMKIVAVAGLAQNFGAIGSLVTTGIQKGHMKMHLLNILNRYEASESEKQSLLDHFRNHTVTQSAVASELEKLRN